MPYDTLPNAIAVHDASRVPLSARVHLALL
jgi:hypothetical protein